MAEKIHQNSLEKRILFFAFVVLTFTIAANTAFHIHEFRRSYRDGILLRCQSLAEGLKVSVEKVLALGIPLQELEGISSRCQEVVATDPEIAYCLIVDRTGNLLYSSDPATQIVSPLSTKTVVGESVSLVTVAGGRTFYDVARALFSADGRWVGTIRIGFSDRVLSDRAKTVFQQALFVLGVALLVVFATIVYFVKRNIISPIDRLCRVATEIASGEFDVDELPMPTRDFSQLGTAIQDMACSLKERDLEIKTSYQELENANSQLQLSYEYQERIGGELARSREMYRLLLDEASDAILVSDEDDRIVLINKAAEALFGMSKSSTEGTNLFSFFDRVRSEDIETLFEVFQKVMEGETTETEICFWRPGEERRLIGWARTSPVFGGDGRRMVQTIIRDVTREREIKENLEKSTRELERLNKMKDSFLGVASHELKTPLTVIIGYVDLLLAEYSQGLDSHLLKMIQHISDSSERLSSIVRDMLDVSMLDEGRIALNRQPTDINALIRKAAHEIEYFFVKRNQSLQLTLEEGVPLVACDSFRMVQVLTNLIVNAIKFTPDGGTITVETCVRDHLRPPVPRYERGLNELDVIDGKLYSYIEIVVRDTGIGIPEKDQVHIFDKFYEVGNIEEHFSNKMAFKGKGTGLGLTIVKGIVEMHGGEVWVDSAGGADEPYPGCAFHVILPVRSVGNGGSVAFLNPSH